MLTHLFSLNNSYILHFIQTFNIPFPIPILSIY